VAETLARRGITTVSAARAFLNPDAYTPTPPEALPDLERAAARLTEAIARGEQICVWGDFDVDGQTSTTLLVATLRELGGRVRYHIPVRATESHGISLPHLAAEIDAGAELVLTCDTGVSEDEAIAYANERGVPVIVTDHHELPLALPPAYAVVNPHRLPEAHPLATLPGVGVAYKLAQALYALSGREGEAAQHLDLVALGIVADVAMLQGDARYLLQRGLLALRETRRLGLQALIASAGLQAAQLREEDIGFGLAPRLNALGRLGDANVIVEFLTTDDLARARVLAAQLEGLNQQRKLLCTQVEQGAEALLERDPTLLEDAALVLAHPGWPAGVIGIVANRLVERYDRPTVLIALGEDGVGRGSARSVEGCHITEAIAEQAALLRGFGGHAMAAGLAIDAEQISRFRRRLSAAVLAQRGRAPEPTLQIDGYLPLEALSLELVADLERLAPFGPGNEPLTLATRDVTIQHHSALGRTGEHLQVVVEDAAGTSQRVVWWRWSGAPLPEGPFDLAYKVGMNSFRGAVNLQVQWVDARVVAPPEPVVEAPSSRLVIEDFRQAVQPLAAVAPWLGREDVQVWAEAQQEIAGLTRAQLTPAGTLVIWSAPPGPEVLQAALVQVAPQRVVLVGVDPGMDARDIFLKRLAGAVKYVLRTNGGQVSLAMLAGVTAQREATVRLGLAWLEAQGHITIVEESTGALQLAPGSGQANETTSRQVMLLLRAALAEAEAYRRYFVQADAERLLAEAD